MRRKCLITIIGINALLSFSSCASGFFPDKDEKASVRPVEEPADGLSAQSAPFPLLRRQDVPLMRMDAMEVFKAMIYFITPDTEMAPSVIKEQTTAYLEFQPGSTAVNPRYKNNSAELEKTIQYLQAVVNNPDNSLKTIRITAFTPPGSNTKDNQRLASNQAGSLKNYLMEELRLSNNDIIRIHPAGEDWEGLRSLIAASGKPYASNVMIIIDNTADPAKRYSLMKALNNGETYRDIEQNYFPRLARMQISCEYESRPVRNAGDLLKQIYGNPDKLTVGDFFRAAALFRPGTEQYREIYEIAAYTYPSDTVAQLNAAAASLALGDTKDARYFLQQAAGDRRAYNNLGVLYLMEGDKETAKAYFRKFASQNPRLSRENIRITDTF
ncbi:OmpA family protein [Parabacteroides bouchesdurhonensis]|uniref:OmpA family protein n=1 Tax=Parabacteroides bouchesdurhonensis TaxID=1936995 RepID=UPI000E52789E|nr:OmpA family protein [Parabacteroides bouchesdurhonensis]RHJ94928.1 hypothetical protein DW095_00360 [Bacteroides sp. AM07-16]